MNFAVGLYRGADRKLNEDALREVFGFPITADGAMDDLITARWWRSINSRKASWSPVLTRSIKATSDSLEVITCKRNVSNTTPQCPGGCTSKPALIFCGHKEAGCIYCLPGRSLSARH